jgi:putative NADH-flavin reductase
MKLQGFVISKDFWEITCCQASLLMLNPCRISKEEIMKLLVFGSTGATGKILVQQALEQRHEVTAFARDPGKVDIRHEHLRIVKGDILEYSTLLPAVDGQDVVISALGIRMLGKNTIMSEGTKNILRAMEAKQVKRFICVSSVGVGESRAQQNRLGWLYNYVVIPVLLRNMFADKDVQEDAIMKSALDWTIVRPVILTNGPKTGQYRSLTPIDLSLGQKISRADVADFLLSQISARNHIKEAVSLSY